LQLRDALAARGKSDEGLKAVLVQRLETALSVEEMQEKHDVQVQLSQGIVKASPVCLLEGLGRIGDQLLFECADFLALVSYERISIPDISLQKDVGALACINHFLRRILTLACVRGVGPSAYQACRRSLTLTIQPASECCRLDKVFSVRLVLCPGVVRAV
jgi:hypothetical protein